MFETITLQLPESPDNMEMQGSRRVRDKQFRQELGAKGKSVIECVGGSSVLCHCTLGLSSCKEGEELVSSFSASSMDDRLWKGLAHIWARSRDKTQLKTRGKEENMR